jgi:hypothetical protein
MILNTTVATNSHDMAWKLLKAVEEFQTRIESNSRFIPNFGECYRHGEWVSAGFVESTVNPVVSIRFCKNSKCSRPNAARISSCRSGDES